MMEVSPRWFGQVQRRDSRYIAQALLKMDLPGMRNEVNHREDSWM